MSEDSIRFHCAHCDFVTSKRDTFELNDHVNKTHPEHTFLCGNRLGMADRLMRGNRDCWHKEPNGDHTCSYCGSMSEENLFDILQHYVDGDEGYRFDSSTKSYKLYAQRPGVRNAGDGAIKFYKCHINPDHPDFKKREELFAKAMERFRAEMSRRFGARPSTADEATA